MENGNEKQGVLPIVSCIVSILEIHVSIWEKKKSPAVYSGDVIIAVRLAGAE